MLLSIHGGAMLQRREESCAFERSGGERDLVSLKDKIKHFQEEEWDGEM